MSEAAGARERQPVGTADNALTGLPARRREISILGPLAVVLALRPAFLTFNVFAHRTPQAPTHDVVVILLLGIAVTVMLLLSTIVREVWQVMQARRS